MCCNILSNTRPSMGALLYGTAFGATRANIWWLFRSVPSTSEHALLSRVLRVVVIEDENGSDNDDHRNDDDDENPHDLNQTVLMITIDDHPTVIISASF